jgi:hypothetical protein
MKMIRTNTLAGGAKSPDREFHANRVKVSRMVEAERSDLFHFTDCCYNDSLYYPELRESTIVKLPNPEGTGKVSRFVGNMMGCRVEWEGESVAWKENEFWVMRGTKGLPATLHMQTEMRFGEAGPGKTDVTISIAYRAPYPILGRLLNALFLRREIRRMANGAIDGLKRAAAEGRIQSLASQRAEGQTDNAGLLPPVKTFQPTQVPADLPPAHRRMVKRPLKG